EAHRKKRSSECQPHTHYGTPRRAETNAVPPRSTNAQHPPSSVAWTVLGAKHNAEKRQNHPRGYPDASKHKPSERTASSVAPHRPSEGLTLEHALTHGEQTAILQQEDQKESTTRPRYDQSTHLYRFHPNHRRRTAHPARTRRRPDRRAQQ